jgi:hypothetical protein
LGEGVLTTEETQEEKVRADCVQNIGHYEKYDVEGEAYQIEISMSLADSRARQVTTKD